MISQKEDSYISNVGFNHCSLKKTGFNEKNAFSLALKETRSAPDIY